MEVAAVLFVLCLALLLGAGLWLGNRRNGRRG